MDALAGLLDGPRAHGAFLLKAVFAPPWSLRIEDEAPLSVIVVLSGEAVFTGAIGPMELMAGAVVLARGPSPYTLADSRETTSDIRVLPGQSCVDPLGHLVDQSMALGVRTWGNSRSGTTTMLIGTYQRATEVGAHVLSRLPSETVLQDFDSPLIALLTAEISDASPGQGAVLDRLLDLVLVTALRQVFSTAKDHAPTWYAAREDPVAGRAIELIHHHPAHPWSVASLADACGVSRATLARRFARSAAQTPMAFLAGWRLAIAADLLSDPQLTLGTVAARVGYADAFALSAAFKRVYGVAPSDYRRRSMTSEAATRILD